MKVYTGNPEDRIVLERGVYKGYKFLILSLGNFPTAYVGVYSTSKYFGEVRGKMIDDIVVHDGITYSDFMKGEGRIWWLGWAYNVYSDYALYSDGSVRNGKMWTVDKIKKHCLGVIEQLIKGDK